MSQKETPTIETHGETSINDIENFHLAEFQNLSLDDRVTPSMCSDSLDGEMTHKNVASAKSHKEMPSLDLETSPVVVLQNLSLDSNATSSERPESEGGLSEDELCERIGILVEPMTEMLRTYFKPTEIANDLQTLDAAERISIHKDSHCNPERGMHSLLERLEDLGGAPLIEFYKLITKMDEDTGLLPHYLLSGDGVVKKVALSGLMAEFFVELVDQKKLDKLTSSDLTSVVDRMVNEGLMKKPKKSVESMKNVVETFFKLLTQVRKSNPDWPFYLWKILQDIRPDLFPPEIPQDDASSHSTGEDHLDNAPPLSGLTDTAANLSSNYSSMRSTETKSKREIQQLHIKVKDISSVNMMMETGALRDFQVTTEEVKRTKSAENAWNNIRADFSDGEDEDEEMERTERKVIYTGVDVDLNLREYQKELAKDALEGKNTIVCAPTGCGKTRVAMDIIIKHLNGDAESKHRSKKVCFFTRTVPLAVQQYKTIMKNLPEKYKINIFTGDSEFSADMHLLLDDLDVVVLTPMILQNHISRGNVMGLSVFSLLIFDECHHTREKEPYNTLMGSYVDRKLKDEQKLPQVIGLTASFPVEKAKSAEGATESILQLCANLDAHIISVVVENKAELEKLVPVPNEKIEYLQERDNDESYKKIISIMQKLEKDARDCAAEIADSGIMSAVSCCPSDNRKLQKYNNWTVELYNKAVLIPRSSRETNMSVRLLLIITEYLTKYHFALETHDLVHLDDVINYLDVCFAEHKTDEYQTNGETRLYDYFRGLKECMRSLRHGENPNLRHLVRVIDEKLLKVGPSSRGIIFVRTRAIAEALSSWLNYGCESEEIRNLKASIFTGTNAKESQGGMTQAQQNALVEKFREGTVRLLVATSVAEEGMDVPECNLVIKYNHVGNEITTIQTRGRSRKVGGHSVLLAMSNICEKEMLNKKRTELMYEGIKLARKMDYEDFIDKVISFQIKAKDHRELEALIDSKNKTMYKDKKFTMICKLCRKFSIHSDNLRTLFQNHRIVLDRNVWDHKRIYITDPKYLAEIQIVGSVRCDIEVENGTKCRGPLGTLIYYSSSYFLAVGIKNFTINEENRNEPRAVKKWKQLQYPLQEITSEDIKNYIKQERKILDSQQDSGTGLSTSSHSNDSITVGKGPTANFGVQETTEPTGDSFMSSYGASVTSFPSEESTLNKARPGENSGRFQQYLTASSSISSYTSSVAHHETEPKEVIPPGLDSGVTEDLGSSSLE